MKELKLSSWEEFEKEATELLAAWDKPKPSTSTLLFRGQSKSSWRLETTLERYARGSLKVKDYYQTIYRPNINLKASRNSAGRFQPHPIMKIRS